LFRATILLLSGFYFLNPISAQTLYPYLKGQLYGFADTTARVVIEPRYDEVSNFGSPYLFSKYYQKNKKNTTALYWPEDIALIYKDSLWNLIDRNGAILLEKGFKSKIQFATLASHPFTADPTSEEQLRILTENADDGWGIWDVNNSTTKGFIYSNNYHDYNDASDLRKRKKYKPRRWYPFRQLECGRCYLARRKNGSEDLIAKYGSVLATYIELGKKPKWAALDQKERTALEEMYYDSLCTQLYKPPVIPTEKNEINKNKFDPKAFMQNNIKRNQLLTDSLGAITGETYDEIKTFTIDLKRKWTALLSKSNKKLDIFDEAGHFIYTVKSDNIPKSIAGNQLGIHKAVFLSGLDKKVLIDENGKEIFPPNMYQDILLLNNHVTLAFPNENTVFPVHIYDKEWNRIIPEEIHKISSWSNAVTVIDSHGDSVRLQFDNGFLPKQINEPGSFDFIPLKAPKKTVTPPLLPGIYTARKNDSPIVGGMEAHLTVPQTRVVLRDILLQRIRKNKKRSGSPSVFLDKEGNQARLVITKSNIIFLDTTVQEFLFIDSDKKLARVVMDGDTISLELKNKKRSFYRNQIADSYMYFIRNGNNYELKAANDSIIATKPAYLASTTKITPAKFSDDRYVFRINHEDILLLNKQGQVLTTFQVQEQNRFTHFIAKSNDTSFQTFDLIDKNYLKVFSKKPFLINLNNLNEFREK